MDFVAMLYLWRRWYKSQEKSPRKSVIKSV